jgi:hypothetical protein
MKMADLVYERAYLIRPDGVGRLGHELLTPVPLGAVDELRRLCARAGLDVHILRRQNFENRPVRPGNVRHHGSLDAKPLKRKPAVGDDAPQPLDVLLFSTIRSI